MNHRLRFVLSLIAATAGAPLASCDDTGPPVSAPIALNVRALSGTACVDPDNPAPGANPFADISTLTIAVRGLNAQSGAFDTLVRESTALKGATSLRVKNVPEGTGREVVLYGKGSAFNWYAKDPDVTIRRSSDNPVDLLFTRFGGFSCVPAPTTLPNVTFPGSVLLGDGRVMVSGGFTDVVTDASGSRLTHASNLAFMFDPANGALTPLGSMGTEQGRAGHAMVYLPAADQVLIVGGFQELRLDETREFPFVFDAADKANARNDYVVFDVATGVFTAGADTMTLKRGFPRAHALADGTALITGGGPWPLDPNDSGYLNVEVYDPQANDGAGGLLDTTNFRSFYTRAGHSLTFLKDSTEGLSQLLVWGGTTPDRSIGHPAEVFRQSGRQREGINGTFVEVTIVGEAPAYSYFHETTRLTGQRFLVTGGVPYDGSGGVPVERGLRAPRSDEAWLLTYVEDPSPILQVQKVPGLGAGRVFHTAASSDLVNVTVVGGFTGLEAITTDTVRYFDLGNPAAYWTTDAGASAQFAPRGGHAGVLTGAGSIVLAGGEANARPVGAIHRASVEVFTPSNLPVP